MKDLHGLWGREVFLFKRPNNMVYTASDVCEMMNRGETAVIIEATGRSSGKSVDRKNLGGGDRIPRI